MFRKSILVLSSFVVGAYASICWADQRTIRTIEEPIVSQPPPFSSGGTTVIVPRTRIIIDEGRRYRNKVTAQETEIKGLASVIDGDTIRIEGRIIHLYGIDAVEAAQVCRIKGIEYPCGVMATARLVSLTLEKIVICMGEARNRAGELSGICWAGETDINDALVRQGWALAYGRESDRYVTAQNYAKKNKSGLWRGEFVRPWAWRINH